ncbi:MAG: sugar phosphate isomerase/epimerase [Clostridia bacterium]|nr:sugar phosphate isomerase/epimerase [Clostridia bacterium]
MKIGAQLFTVREFCKTTDDFADTLQRIADIGYKTVQVSGTCPFEAAWLAEQLQKTGLKCALTHTPKERLIAETEAVIAEHGIFDCRYIGLGYHKFTGETADYDAFCKTYLPVAEKIAHSDRHFMYHNHASEFIKIGNQTILQKLFEDFSAAELGFTLDTYWIQVGGADPADYIERFSGRVQCIHLKDYAYGPTMAVVGEGNINFDRVFEKARDAGTEYMFVEQDHCNGEDPFECLRRSYAYLKSRGFS